MCKIWRFSHVYWKPMHIYNFWHFLTPILCALLVFSPQNCQNWKKKRRKKEKKNRLKHQHLECLTQKDGYCNLLTEPVKYSIKYSFKHIFLWLRVFTVQSTYTIEGHSYIPWALLDPIGSQCIGEVVTYLPTSVFLFISKVSQINQDYPKCRHGKCTEQAERCSGNFFRLG